MWFGEFAKWTCAELRFERSWIGARTESEREIASECGRDFIVGDFVGDVAPSLRNAFAS